MFNVKLRKKVYHSAFKIFVFLTVSLSAVAIAPGLFNGGFSHAQQNDAASIEAGERLSCTNTKRAAYKACINSIRDDYWIAVGNCNNLSDIQERRECIKEAEKERKEAKEECKEQRAARSELCDGLGESPYDPQLISGNFVNPADITPATANPYFPLLPGTIWIYEGETEEGTETVTVTVLNDTKEIEYKDQTFICRVVRDIAEIDGVIIEDTDDWFAQDIDGNVWYFGELSREFEDGEMVSLEGSWKAGEDSAKPGVLIWANPDPDNEDQNPFRQEFFLGEAEDSAEVVSVGDETVTVPLGGGTTFDTDVLKTSEFTPLEPDVEEFKYYAPDIGLIKEVDLESGETIELIDMTTP